MPIACMQAACAAGESAEDPYEGLASCVARMKGNRAGLEQLRAGQLKADDLIKPCCIFVMRADAPAL